jgi:1-acyl-sn-glycerol-3-phosphate acyltransferase
MAMIEAKHSKWFDRVFNLYLTFSMKKHFRGVTLLGEMNDMGLPLLVIANHISWWDGFWVLQLNRSLFRRRFHVMMLEEQLRKNMFLRKLGAFSIMKNSIGIRHSLNYAVRILEDNDNLLLFFPQGKISSQYSPSVHFEKGISSILTRIKNPVQVVMIVHLLDYSSHQKPLLFQYIQGIRYDAGMKEVDLAEAYNHFYARCMNSQTEMI